MFYSEIWTQFYLKSGNIKNDSFQPLMIFYDVYIQAIALPDFTTLLIEKSYRLSIKLILDIWKYCLVTASQKKQTQVICMYLYDTSVIKMYETVTLKLEYKPRFSNLFVYRYTPTAYWHTWIELNEMWKKVQEVLQGTVMQIFVF